MQGTQQTQGRNVGSRGSQGHPRSRSCGQPLRGLPTALETPVPLPLDPEPQTNPRPKQPRASGEHRGLQTGS